MKTRIASFARIASIGLTVAAAMTPSLMPAQSTWSGTAGAGASNNANNRWGRDQNWSPSGVPTSATTAVVAGTVIYEIYVAELSGGTGAAYSLANLHMNQTGGGSATLHMLNTGVGSSVNVSNNTWIQSPTTITATGLTTSRLVLASGSTLTLNAGTTSVTSQLAGVGSIAGAGTLLLGSSASHTPGGALSTIAGSPTSGIGLQGVSNLTYSSGSTFLFDFAGNSQGTRGTNYDAVNVSGTMTVSSGTVFNMVTSGTDFNNSFWQSNRTWGDIFNVGTLVGSFTNENLQLNGGSRFVGEIGFFSISGTNLSWTYIPEPSTALAGILLAAGLLRRRRLA